MPKLTAGDPAPWFSARSTSNPIYHFNSVGGYRVVLSFFGSSKSAKSGEALNRFCALQSEFEQLNVPFFGVSIDPNDMYLAKWIKNPTYLKFIWDFDYQVSLLYGICRIIEGDANQIEYTATTFVLDERLTILGVFAIADPTNHVEQVINFLKNLPAPEPPSIVTRQAPVLLIPHVLEPEFCQYLINLYEANGGSESGFMRQLDGKTVGVLDYSFKQRRDFLIQDPSLLTKLNNTIWRRVKPEIEKAFQFTISRYERYLVACYEDTNQGFFNSHRDNTTKGTAHRRFAMSLNLNTGDYEGGFLKFPEYGSHLYRPGIGEAVIFSCSLLHQATPVTQGHRFVLLSFFYDEEDAKLRQQNLKYLVSEPNPATQNA